MRLSSVLLILVVTAGVANANPPRGTYGFSRWQTAKISVGETELTSCGAADVKRLQDMVTFTVSYGKVATVAGSQWTYIGIEQDTVGLKHPESNAEWILALGLPSPKGRKAHASIVSMRYDKAGEAICGDSLYLTGTYSPSEP